MLGVSKKFTLAFKITVKTKQKENANHNGKYIMQYKILISLLRNYVGFFYQLLRILGVRKHVYYIYPRFNDVPSSLPLHTRYL